METQLNYAQLLCLFERYLHRINYVDHVTVNFIRHFYELLLGLNIYFFS